MSDSQKKLRSINPNVPKNPHWLYSNEKANFAGILIGSVLYGIVVVLFFKCMTTLLNPFCRRGKRIKWGLVSYTAVTFLFVTVFTAMYLDILSFSYIDNREFPGVEGVAPSGPFGYQWFISSGVFGTIPNVVFSLSNWLADGHLLYRYYVIYSKNLWTIAFPCLMYFGSVAMGTAGVYQTTQLLSSHWAILPYFSISLSLNVLLTLMIVIRLVLYTRDIRSVTGEAGIGGLCKTIVTILIESCALYTAFFPILAEAQAIAPLLVVQRVANKSALTSTVVASGRISEFKARTRGESADGSGAVPSEDPANSVNECGMNSSEPWVETTNDSHREEIH